MNTKKNILFLLLFLGVVWRGGEALAEFADVDVTHPYFHAIQTLEQDHVVKGYTDGNVTFFRPLQPVLRSEAMKMLVLGANIDIETGGNFFPDVDAVSWYAPYVNTAAAQEIVSGFSDGNFHPSAQVSRAEFLKMVLLGFGAEVRDEQPDEDWYKRFLEKASELNIIDSPDKNPYESLSRGELSEILYRTQYTANHDFEKRYVYSGNGKASYYNEGFAGNSTASGESYDPSDLTAAHRTLPFGTYVKVSYDNKFVIVRINDRGPYHSTRIIDLSQRAFELLAPTSKGVIDIQFEIVSGPEEVKAPVPEYIRPEFMTELKNEQIPIVVSQKIEESKPGARKRKNAEAPIIPLFDETISHLSQDFFPNADLRSSIPQKLTVGTVMNFSGTARESGFSKATVFLQKLSESGVVEGEQTHFSGVVSGHNFSFPIMFLQPGKFYIGLVFDDSNKSRVGEIEVVSTIKKRVYPALESDFSSDLDIRLIPEEQKITLGWNMTDTTDISKITFTQKNKSKEIFIEDGISSIELLYSFFQDFTEGQPLAIELSQAFSRDGTLANQIMSWKPVLSRNYELVSGFPDSESEKISISHFPRYIKTLSSILLEGEIKEDVSLAENAFVIMPNGFVKEFPVEFFGNNAFRVQIQPEDWGRMIFELITDKGEILFNRAFYISKNYILPIGENNGVPLSTENVSGVRFWTNKFREIHGLEALTGSAQLNEFAQKYAEQMADENFISHITPTGLTFTQRLKIADFQGEYGENLSYATTLKLALEGLENSASHRRNMLLRKWRKVGIGLSQNKKREYYVVQIFGK